MTRARRPLAAAAGLALAALVTLPTGAAGQVDDATEWELTWTTTPGQTFREDVANITGTVTSPTGTTITEVRLTATRISTTPACPGESTQLAVTAYPDNDEGTQVTQPDTGRSTFAFSFPLRSRICNGEYHLQVEATADDDLIVEPDPPPPPAPPPPVEDDDVDHAFDSDSDRLGVTLALRPPDVAATSVASPDGRAISLSWQAPSGYSAAAGATPSPPDFLGYVVQRSTDGGTTFSRRASLQPAVSTYTETLGPSDPAGSYVYRVLAIRYGATSSEFTFAAGGATAVARLDVAAPPTSAPPTTARTPTPAAPGRPTGNAPTVLGTVPSTTIDEGFGEIVYDDVEPGEEEAVVPPDADSLLDFASPGAGLLIPFAIAECLAVWALHLRYLARRVDAGV